MTAVDAANPAQDSADQTDTYRLSGDNSPLGQEDWIDSLWALAVNISALVAVCTLAGYCYRWLS